MRIGTSINLEQNFANSNRSILYTLVRSTCITSLELFFAIYKFITIDWFKLEEIDYDNVTIHKKYKVGLVDI